MARLRPPEPEPEYRLMTTPAQVRALQALDGLPDALAARLRAMPADATDIPVSPADLAALFDAIGEALDGSPGRQRVSLEALLRSVTAHLIIDAMRTGGPGPDADERPAPRRRGPRRRSDLVYRLKVTLDQIKPPIWRRVEIPDVTLGELHEILQAVMGWQGCHLHRFEVRGAEYGPPPPDDDFLDLLGPDWSDEDDVLLGELVPAAQPAGARAKFRFRYEYDFGDGWTHTIVVEKVLDPEPDARYPRCLDGARACPPEDVGGPWGYADFLDALADPKHEQHQELREWIGGDWDPETFSAEAVNRCFRPVRVRKRKK